VLSVRDRFEALSSFGGGVGGSPIVAGRRSSWW
jgi:hypothetical protein